MLTATCHCGAVRVEVPRKPRRLTDCNCSICRVYGTLWAYYKASTGRLVCARGATSSYARGDKSIEFIHRKKCGCVVQWRVIRKRPDSRTGVNARNLEPEAIASARIGRLDGAKTWKFLD